MAINRLNPDYPDAGLVQLMPSSVAVGSGSSTVSGNGSVTFSGASSVSLNGIFSATYANYKILLTTTSRVSASVVSMRMRVSNVDNSSANYNGSIIQKPTNSGTITGYSGASATGFEVGSIQANGGVSKIELFDPQTSNHTAFHSVCQSRDGSAGGSQYNDINSGSMSVTTSYDSVTFFGNTGTITGTVSVYGYRN